MMTKQITSREAMDLMFEIIRKSQPKEMEEIRKDMEEMLNEAVEKKEHEDILGRDTVYVVL